MGRMGRLAAIANLTLIGLASTGQAATIQVTTEADVLDGADGLCSLREAIVNANDNAATFGSCAAGETAPAVDTIELPAGTYVLAIAGADEDAAATGDLDVLDHLVIQGAGAADTILDGNQLDRVLEVHPGANLDVARVTIRNGRVDGFGGGMQIRGSGTVTVRDSMVTGNSAASPGSLGLGGGISNNDDGRLTITDTVVTGNLAESAASFAGGGGVSNNSDGELVVARSRISGNTARTVTSAASAALGGGLNNHGSGSQVSIIDSVISGNAAVSSDRPTRGGGLNNNSTGAVTVTGSTIAGNTSMASTNAARGGGLANSSVGTLTVLNSTISANAATGLTGDFGGGVDNAFSGIVELRSSTVVGNSATTGGGIRAAAADSVRLRNT
ncbi:MAG: CSLREA domain-containing protein, partial [Candidatus Rokuibacteriota bacterium]